MMGNLLSPGHLVLVLFVMLLLFGPSKLPELGRSLGRTLKELKEGARETFTVPEIELREEREMEPVSKRAQPTEDD